MDKKGKTKFRIGKSIEEVIVRRRIDASLLPPLVKSQSAQSQSQPQFFSSSTGDFSNSFANGGINDIVNEKVERYRQTAEAEAGKKDKVIAMLTDYCKHLESQVSRKEKSRRPDSSERVNIETTTRGRTPGIPPYSTSMLTKDVGGDAGASAAYVQSPSTSQLQSRGGNPSAPTVTFQSGHFVADSTVSPHGSVAGGHHHGHQHHHSKHHDAEKKHEMHTVIQSTLSHIDTKVINLRQIFRDGDPLTERRRAVTRINAQVRGWLVRIRMQGFKIGLKEWKISRTRRVVWLLSILCGNYVYINAGVEQMIMNRANLLCSSVFSKWVSVSRSTAPLRRKIRAAAEQMYLHRIDKSKRKLFDALKSVSIGRESRVHQNKERKEFVARIRLETSEKLKAQGLVGVVSEEALQMQVNRQILRIFLEKKTFLEKKGLFHVFQNIMADIKKKFKMASQFRFRQKAGKCFYAWTEWCYLVGQGLDRKRWSGPRKYEIRYNQKLVDHFARLRREKFCFGPWKEFFFRMVMVKRMNHRITARFVSNNFHSWRLAARKLHMLRQVTIENWKDYPLLMYDKPFKAWRKHVIATKNFAAEQSRIVNAYIRWKGRQKLSLIIRTWRHQALYGRIDGMYTRRMLITSLAEQKMLSTALEKMLSTQTLEMESCRLLLEAEIGKRKALEEQVTTLENDIVKHRMIEHHLEQETIRLENIIESTALINPRQVDHLRNMQVDFKFKQRKVTLAVPPEDFESLSLVEEVEADSSRPGTAKTTPAPSAGASDAPGAAARSHTASRAASPPAGIAAGDGSVSAESSVTLKDEPVSKEAAVPASAPLPTATVATVAPSAGKAIPAAAPPPVPESAISPAGSRSTTAASRGGTERGPTSPVPAPPLFSLLPPVPAVIPLPTEDRLLLDRAKWFLQRFKTITAPTKTRQDFYHQSRNKDDGEHTGLGDFTLKYDRATAIRKAAQEELKRLEELKKHKELEALKEKTDQLVIAIEHEPVPGPLESAEQFQIRKNAEAAAAAEAEAAALALMLPPKRQPSVRMASVPVSPSHASQQTSASTTPPPFSTQNSGVAVQNTSLLSRPASGTSQPPMDSDGSTRALTARSGTSGPSVPPTPKRAPVEVISNEDGTITNAVEHILVGARPDGAYPDDIAKTLLATLTFFETGDTGGLAKADRKSWIKYVFTQVEEEKVTHQAILAREHENKRIEYMNTLAAHEAEGTATKTEIDQLHHEEQHMLHHHEKKDHMKLETKSWRNALLYLRAVFPTTNSLAPDNGIYLRISDMRDSAMRIMDSNAVKHIHKMREQRNARIAEQKRIAKSRLRHEKLMELRENHKGLGFTDEDLLHQIDDDSDDEDSEGHDSDSDEESIDSTGMYIPPGSDEPLNLYSGNLTQTLTAEGRGTSSSLHDQMISTKIEFANETTMINDMKEKPSFANRNPMPPSAYDK